MRFQWSYCSLCIFCIASFVWGQDFNPQPLNRRPRQTPAGVSPAGITPDAIDDAFEEAANLIRERRAGPTRAAGFAGGAASAGAGGGGVSGFAAAVAPAAPVSLAVARHQRFQLAMPRSQRLDSVQEIFEVTAQVLSRSNQFSARQAAFSLPTDLTSTRQAARVQNCEAQFNVTCRPTDKYRSYDGTCNNVGRPSWGMSGVCFERLVNSAYADGISAKRVAMSGNPLPSPRLLSLELHSHNDNPTDYVTHMFMVWGQFFDHDITQTPQGQGPNGELLNCCPFNPDENCDPIYIEQDDPFFRQFGTTCLSNTRSSKCSTCTLGPRQQINQVTSYIDGSHIYGVNTDQALRLRSNDGTGTMRFVFNPEGGELPPGSDLPLDDACSEQDANFDCFQTGDVRANLHPGLTSLHVLFLREHNRLARRLQEINPTWDEETLYQEARRILGAEMQMITYNEYLPLVLGPERMESFDLFVRRGEQFTEYDESVSATLVNEFSAAAFRFGHSMINSFFLDSRGSNRGNYLRDIFNDPFGMYRGELEGIVEGLTDFPAQKFDRNMVRDITNHLFQDRNNGSGLDLAALNINRGRDHGIPGYTTLVEYCGGPSMTRWSDLESMIESDQRYRFERLYERVEDIDLFSGGLSERPMEGAVVGPTFACILGIQFYHLKYGDRFYFEHGGQAGSFTPAQLRELKKITLAKVICNNARIQELSANAFLYPTRSNPLDLCSNLPDIDLSYWRV